MNVGQECGMTFGDWEGYQEGDRVEAFEVVQVNA